MRFVRELPGDSTQRDIAAHALPMIGGVIVTGWTSRGDAPPQGLALWVGEMEAPQGSAVVVEPRCEVGGEGADLLFAAQPDHHQGLVVAGFTSSRGAGATDGWFMGLEEYKLKTTWEAVVGGAGAERLTSMVPTPEGLLAAGQKDHGGDTDAWIVALSLEGKVLHESTWGGPGVQRALGVAWTPDSGCVICGRMGPRDEREVTDAFVTRLSASGKRLWTSVVGGPGFQVAYSLRSTRDGALLVTGYGYRSEERDHDAFVEKLDAQGRSLFRCWLGGRGYDRGTQTVELPDGSTITVGYSKPVGAAEDAPVWRTVLWGLDAKGRLQWTKTLDGEGYESGHGIALDRGGIWVVSHRTPPSGGSRVVVARLDLPGAAAP